MLESHVLESHVLDFHSVGLLLQGLLVTLLMTLTVVPIGLVFGALLGWMRTDRLMGLGWLAAGYIEFFRSLPLILLLVLIHYGVMPFFFQTPNFYLSSFVTFVLFESAYFAEIFRGGLRSIRQAERDSAHSLGLSYFQEFYWIRLPLAFQRSLPALMNQTVALIKDTSLASIVGVIEFTRAGEIIYEQTFHDFEILLVQAVVYLLLCSVLSYYAERLTRVNSV